MYGKRLFLLGALLCVTRCAAAADPLPAAPEAPQPPANATGEAAPQPSAYVMTICNGCKVVQKVWIREDGSWRTYTVVPDEPAACAARTPPCAAAACVRYGRPDRGPCSPYTPPWAASAR